MVDDGLCMDGPYEEDVEPALGLSVDELHNMTLEEYTKARESLLFNMHTIDTSRKLNAWRNR